jgi:hypothetical protein
VRVKLFKHGATRTYGGSEVEDLRILKFYSRWSFVVSLNSLSVLLPFNIVTFPWQQLERQIGHPVHKFNQSRSLIVYPVTLLIKLCQVFLRHNSNLSYPNLT